MKENKQFQRTEDGHLILMSPEDRKLLITDLTSRIEYGVICMIERVDDFGPIHRNEKLTGFCNEENGYFYFDFGYGLTVEFAEKVKPYLRPMSSMTEEEKEELLNLLFDKEAKYFYIDEEGLIDGKTSYLMKEGLNYPAFCPINIVLYTDWLNAHHFDYRGLIEKGLAFEAPEGMYEN
jgi:hypothetical protein